MARQKALRVGARGQRWLAGLTDLVAELEREWSITVGPCLPGGTASLVAQARTVDGRESVLKLGLPDGPPERPFADEVRTIAAAEGRGYVGLLAHDLDRRAMLLEALGPAMIELDLAAERVLVALSRTLVQAWTVPRPPAAVISGQPEKADQLSQLVSRLWEQLDRPCSEKVVTKALEFARRRAATFDLERSVIVHGDPHPGNALQVRRSRPGAESGFVFVDPDGFLADPAYDLGVVLRDWCPQLLAGDASAIAHGYCRLLATETGLDETAIWEWGFLERVSSGLYVLSLGDSEAAEPFLRTAEKLT